MQTLTNAALAKFHAAQAARFANLARRDAGLPTTEENADYQAAAQGQAIVVPDANTIQIPVSAISEEELENLLAMASMPRKTPAEMDAFLAHVSCTEERLSMCALPAKVKGDKAPLKAKKEGTATPKAAGGLRGKQIAVLELMADNKKRTIRDVSRELYGAPSGHGVDNHVFGTYGPNQASGLIALGYVKECEVGAGTSDNPSKKGFQITPEGRKALKEAKKAATK